MDRRVKYTKKIIKDTEEQAKQEQIKQEGQRHRNDPWSDPLPY